MKACLIVVMLLAGLSSFGQQNNFILKGKINGQDKGIMYLYSLRETKLNKDSATIDHGSFEFKGEISEPHQAFLSTEKNSKLRDNPFVGIIYLEPGMMTVEVPADDFRQLKVTGSKTQDEYVNLNKELQEVRQESKPLDDEYDKANMAYIMAKKADRPESELSDLKDKAQNLHEQLDKYSARSRKIIMNFVDTHPESYYAASMLRYFVSSMKPELAMSYYNKFPDKVKQSSYGKAVQAQIEGLKTGSPGRKAFVFAKADINGQPFNLADYQSKKYVLIDFWASWCVPCRAGNPHLLTLYNKYKDKGLEIVGVADDDGAIQDWKKAVNKDQIGVWRHVLRGLKKTSTGFDRSEDISEHYGIHSLPTKILVDKNGEIVGRFGDGGDNEEEMDKRLAAIFN